MCNFCSTFAAEPLNFSDMKKIVLTLLTLLTTMIVTAGEQNVIAIYQTDGQVAMFAFADKPEVRYTATDLVLTTNGTAVQYPISQLKKVQFEKAEINEGLDELLADGHFSFRDGAIEIHGGKPNSMVKIFTISGALTAQYPLDSNGDGVIPTQSLRGTTYIVTAGSFSFKFMQP